MSNPQGKLSKVEQSTETQHTQVAFFPKVLHGCQASSWFYTECCFVLHSFRLRRWH